MKLLLKLSFILLAFIFIGFSIALNFSSSDSFINRELRPYFQKSALSRRLFRLDQPGDNRFAYTSPRVTEILVEVDYQSQAVLNLELSSWLETMIQDTTDKTAVIRISPDPIQSSAATTDKSLVSLAKATQTYTPDSHQQYLHLIYLPESVVAPSNSGLVLQDDTIYIFTSAIKGLSDKQHILAKVEQSTIMHEWGHLLGVEHLEAQDCIMSQVVEVYGNRIFQGSNIPTEYCGETLYQISQLSAS